jgi:flagellar basal-body rod protein FlgC
MDLTKSLMVSAAGLRAQTARMRVVAENIANADWLARTPNEMPYRRKTISFESELDRAQRVDLVKVDRIGTDPTPFGRRYEPGHPAADAAGYVATPNVEPVIEMVDMQEAQRSYSANITAIEAARRMMLRTIDLLRD